MKALQISALLTKGLSFTSRFKLIQNRIVRSHNKHELHKVLCRARSSSVELTSVRHPEIIRGNYSRLTEDDLSVFRNILTTNRCVSDPADVESYNVDWMKSYRGMSRLVLLPKTTKEVSQLLSYCNERHLAVVPQGGNTGLVGGSVPVFDEIIISTRLMNEIISVDDVSGILVCEAGCILEQLDKYLEEHQLTMPLDLGAKGSCHIGGNIATNAGGIRFLRYGSLHGSVLGLEVVLANGEILDCLTRLRKDNTGYDLKQLFIGSEGTLGFITKVAIVCPQKPSSVNVALVGCQSFMDVLDIFKTTKRKLAEILSAFEFLDTESMNSVTDNLKLTRPISECPFYVLMETFGSNGTHDEEKLNYLIEELTTKGLVQDGTIAADITQIKHLWSLRERVAESVTKNGSYCYKYDLSLKLSGFYDLVLEVRKRVSHIPNTVVMGYGHVGDSNIHVNVVSPKYDPYLLSLLEPFIFDYVATVSGSVSAEHGIGIHKPMYLHHSKSSSAINLMRLMKQTLDSHAILNPYKIFLS